MTETTKKALWRRLLAFWPVLAVLAIFMVGRNPMACSPDEPPASARGAVFDLSFTPL